MLKFDDENYIEKYCNNINTEFLEGYGALTLTQVHYVIYLELETNFLEAARNKIREIWISLFAEFTT